MKLRDFSLLEKNSYTFGSKMIEPNFETRSLASHKNSYYSGTSITQQVVRSVEDLFTKISTYKGAIIF